MKSYIEHSDGPLPEWDVRSSPTTVYHRRNMREVTDADGRTTYEYDTDKMTQQEYNLQLQEQLDRRAGELAAANAAILAIMDGEAQTDV